jgi:hypothetical protein
MADSSDIDNALVAKLLADSALMAFVPDGVFVDEAGASLVTGGNATRFVIVSLVEEADAAKFGGRSHEDALYQVEARMLSTVAGANITAAADRIDALLEQGTLTAAGYSLMALFRESRIRLTEVDDADSTIRWYRRGGNYRLMMSVG